MNGDGLSQLFAGRMKADGGSSGLAERPEVMREFPAPNQQSPCGGTTPTNQLEFVFISRLITIIQVVNRSMLYTSITFYDDKLKKKSSD